MMRAPSIKANEDTTTAATILMMAPVEIPGSPLKNKRKHGGIKKEMTNTSIKMVIELFINHNSLYLTLVYRKEMVTTPKRFCFSDPLKRFFCHQMTATNYGINICCHISAHTYHPPTHTHTHTPPNHSTLY